MRYALVDIKKEEEGGFDPKLHRTTTDGRMVVNENELRAKFHCPAEEAAEKVGVTLLSETEIFNELKRMKK